MGSMSYSQLLFSFEGRIGRATYWLRFFVPYMVGMVVLFGIGSVLSMPSASDPGYAVSGEMSTGQLVMTAIFLVYLLIGTWCSLAVYAKRWHDRDKSGWWTLIVLVPGLGGIWLLIDCGFLKGTDGPNRFGADPVGAGDYQQPTMEPQM